MFGHLFVWMFFAFSGRIPRGFLARVSLTFLQSNLSTPTPLFPWDRCPPNLGFFGFDIVWHLHLLTKVVPACGFLPEFETLGSRGVSPKKSLEKSVWSSKLHVDIFAFQFFLCHLETKGKNVKCPYETTPPHKRRKKTPVPHTGPPHMMLQKAVLDFGDGSILRLIHDDWLATKALQIAAPALMVRGPFIHFTPWEPPRQKFVWIPCV